MDQFLFAHKWTGLPLFDLASQFNTISIRDQMVRALLLADRLPTWLETQLGLDYLRHPVLIVGGGACGMTIAVELAKQGLTVEVAERDGHLFNLQRGCRSRWLDPTQYDWPLDNWRVQKFPLDRAHRNAPFTWGPNTAVKIAQRWGAQLSRHLRHVPDLQARLTFRRPIEAGLNPRYLDQLRLLRVQFNDPQSGHAVGWSNYGAVVWAFGHGDERCALPNSPQFHGIPFWQTDDLELAHCGLAGGRAQEGTVLISGGGDGALQDFLRLITRQPSVRDIFDELQLQNVGIDVHSILSAEQRAERALNWSTGAVYASPYMTELQECHERAVRAILPAPGLQARIDSLVAARPQKTILVTRQDSLVCNYPLNRFLSLLLIQGVTDGSVEWRAGWEVERIQSIPAPPLPPSPQNCVGHEWRVTTRHVQGRTAPATIDANVILLRHGLERPEITLPPGPSLPRLARPMPPTHLL